MKSLNFCNIDKSYTLSTFFEPTNPAGLIRLLACLLSFLGSLLTIFWIKRQEYLALYEDYGTVKNVIFPIFVQVLWISALINVYYAVIILFFPFPSGGNNSLYVSIAYASVSSLQHGVSEGIAFMLMQKGCGKYAASRVLRRVFVWVLLTFSVFTLFFWKGSYGHYIIDTCELLFDCTIFLFYAMLWCAPNERVYRRPAAIIYSSLMASFRFVVIIVDAFVYIPAYAEYSQCGYLFTWLVIFPLTQPYVCYHTLLEDSRWWQGLGVYGIRSAGISDDNVRSPLMGTDFSLQSAQSLGIMMDLIRGCRNVKMLNFARINVDYAKILGAGSFSKVYSGLYRNQICAVKLIYTVDLTVEIVERIAAEASILSSIQHPNVVEIIGVSVLPPSVCLVLEYCCLGSLSDILRGCTEAHNGRIQAALNLSQTDKIFLALGCARGLAAVHHLDPNLCHRDVKSFNFLVDEHLNAKIADLELGVRTEEEEEQRAADEEGAGNGNGNGNDNGSSAEPRPTAPEEWGLPDPYSDSFGVGDFLPNWMAPEVIRTHVFRQPADVYSLAMVIWEIDSLQLPFENCVDGRSEIKRLVTGGFRHKISEEAKKSGLGRVIEQGWAQDPEQRLSAGEMAASLQGLLAAKCYDLVIDVNVVPDLSDTMLLYEMSRQCGSPRVDSGDVAETKFSSSIKMTGHIHSQIEEDVFTVLGLIQDDPKWEALEDDGKPWAVVSSDAPYVFVYMTSAWLRLFERTDGRNIGESVRPRAPYPTWPLTALEDVIDTSSSNQAAAERFLRCLSTYREAHGILQAVTGETIAASASPSFSDHMSVGSGSVRSGSFRCSLHAFPLYCSAQSEYKDFEAAFNKRPKIPYIAIQFNRLDNPQDLARSRNTCSDSSSRRSRDSSFSFTFGRSKPWQSRSAGVSKSSISSSRNSRMDYLPVHQTDQSEETEETTEEASI